MAGDAAADEGMAERAAVRADVQKRQSHPQAHGVHAGGGVWGVVVDG